MSKFVDQLLGETTTCSGIPTREGPPLGVATPPGTGLSRAEKLRRLRQRRNPERRLHEDESGAIDSLFPKDAKELEGHEQDPNIRLKAKGDEGSGRQLPEPLITTAVALVAPDATPDAGGALDPSQVPAPPAPSKPAAVSTTTQPDAMAILMGKGASGTRVPGVPTPADFARSEQPAESLDPGLAAATVPGTGMPQPVLERKTDKMMNNIRGFL